MNKIRVKDFFLRVSEELPSTRFNWLSVVESDLTNRIYAEVEVKRGSIICLNHTAINAYGRSRHLRDINKEEWIHKFSVRRKITGPIFDLETFL